MAKHDQSKHEQPRAVLGAGELTAHLIQQNSSDGRACYRFNVFRVGRRLNATHLLRPQDLRDIVKLCQLLAFAIVDDGWIGDDLRGELTQLNRELDQVTAQWRRDGR